MTQVDSPQSVCRFGLAVRDITPPVGIYHRMWGAARHDRSTGVHRPLRATAMAFGPEGGDTADAEIVLALDHCLLFRPEVEKLLDRVCAAVPVERERIVVTFSHTHAAGLMDPGRSELPGGDRIAPYLEELGAKLAEGAREALARREPVCITYCSGRCDLARHRDYRDVEREIYVCGFNPHQDADDTVLIAGVTGEDGATRATIVNYACHPTTLAWDNELISPDYPGAMRELVEEATGAPCVFLQGASGELGPRDGFVGDPQVADRNGRQLGHAALAALESAPPPRTILEYSGPVVSGATLGTWRHRELDAAELDAKRIWKRVHCTVDLPYRDDLMSLEESRSRLDDWSREEREALAAGRAEDASRARAMAERMTRQVTRLSQLPRGDHFPCPVDLWRAGDAVWLAVAGEPYSFLQRTLRERFPRTPIAICALSGGWGPSYLPTAETYGRGIYQESIAVVARGSLEKLVEAIAREIEEVLE